MKKLYLILTAVTALSLVTLSCTKELADPSQQEQIQKEEDPAKEAGEEQTIPEGMISLTFGVSQEGDAAASDEDTKTSWDGTTHAWSEDDQVRIIWGEGDSDYVDAEVVGGKVTATVADADYYYAVYPTTATYALDLANEKLTITVPRYQSGSFSDANIMAAKTAKAAANLEFKNMTSIIKFTTGSTYSYNSVSFMANEQTKLTGTVSTTFPSEFAVETANGSESIVCIQKGNPTGNAGVSAGNTYYLAMLPGAEITNGIGFKIEQRASETDLLGGAISKSAFARERSKIYDMGTLDSRIIKDWYISESGNGAGNDPMDPAGPARLMDLLNPAYSTNNTTAGWRLTGAIVHVASGTYNLQALNGGEVFDPHYNLSNLKVHVKGEGTASNPTKFICNQELDTDFIFTLSGSHRVGDFTFENITFAPAEGKSHIVPGTAFCFDSSAASNISFDGCTFSGFTQDGTINGGPIYVKGTGAVVLTFNDCTFSGNSCNTGGTAYFYNPNAIISITDCTFSGNSSASNGGAIRARAFDSLSISGGSFDSNKSTNAGNKGGAIYVDGGTTVTIDGTTFSNNIGGTWGVTSPSGRGGALLFASSAAVTVKNATFSGNKASNGGAIHTEKGSSVYIVNSTFTGNNATNGASIRSEGATGSLATIIIFNSLFSGNKVTGTGTKGGFDVQAATNFSRMLIANSTFRSLEGNAAFGTSDAPNFNVVSCTFNENTADFNRNFNNGKFYNSILASAELTAGNNLKAAQYYSIFGNTRYGEGGTTTAVETEAGLAAACLGSYSNGVYPLNSLKEASYSAGMSSDDIKKLTFTDITLTDEQIDLLAKDQKGNKREGTIMGAYVKTTAPTE